MGTAGGFDPSGAAERFVREGEDATVGSDHEVAVAVATHADEGLFRWEPPIDPRKGALKAKMPSSEETM